MPNANVFISSLSLPMPTVVSGRGGGAGVYPIADLPVGKSIVVKNKTKKQLTTTISSANRKDWPALTADGKPIVGKTEKRAFFAVDCDPATDPEQATARIWRNTNPAPASAAPVTANPAATTPATPASGKAK